MTCINFRTNFGSYLLAINTFLKMNFYINKYQSGFLPGHSTVHHLIELVHNTCLSLENHEANCQVFVIYLKLSTGFGIGD